jgi:hypothetical protein
MYLRVTGIDFASFYDLNIFGFGIVPTVCVFFAFYFIKQIPWKMNFIYFKKINNMASRLSVLVHGLSLVCLGTSTSI